MLKVQRQDQLQRLCDARGLLSVTEAAELLGTSPMTIRRDMDELAAEGKINRVRGGAKSILPPREVAHERSRDEKLTSHLGEKHHIAKLAADLVNDGDTVFVGAGTTCELMATYLKDKHIRVATNSLPAFEGLKDSESVELYLLGGLWRAKTTVFYGPMTMTALGVVNFDMVFFGVNGLEGKNVTGHNIEIAELQRRAYDKGRKRYILADSSKFGRRDFFIFYELTDIDAVITDRGITPEQRADIEQYTRIIC